MLRVLREVEPPKGLAHRRRAGLCSRCKSSGGQRSGAAQRGPALRCALVCTHRTFTNRRVTSWEKCHLWSHHGRSATCGHIMGEVPLAAPTFPCIGCTHRAISPHGEPRPTTGFPTAAPATWARKVRVLSATDGGDGHAARAHGHGFVLVAAGCGPRPFPYVRTRWQCREWPRPPRPRPAGFRGC